MKKGNLIIILVGISIVLMLLSGCNVRKTGGAVPGEVRGCDPACVEGFCCVDRPVLNYMCLLCFKDPPPVIMPQPPEQKPIRPPGPVPPPKKVCPKFKKCDGVSYYIPIVGDFPYCKPRNRDDGTPIQCPYPVIVPVLPPYSTEPDKVIISWWNGWEMRKETVTIASYSPVELVTDEAPSETPVDSGTPSPTPDTGETPVDLGEPSGTETPSP